MTYDLPLPRRPRWAAAVAAACAAALLGACGASGAGSVEAAGAGGAGAPSRATPVVLDPALRDALPPDVRASGRLRVVTEASYAPASAFGPDGRTIVGFEPDLGAALGAVLGLKVTFTNASFDRLPALVQSGSADLVMSAMTDTRQRERALDFVNYFSAGSSIVVQRGCSVVVAIRVNPLWTAPTEGRHHRSAGCGCQSPYQPRAPPL